MAIWHDPAASALWDEVVEALAGGLLIAMSLIDPTVIVLGGGLTGAGARLMEPLATAVRARARAFHAVADLRLVLPR